MQRRRASALIVVIALGTAACKLQVPESVPVVPSAEGPKAEGAPGSGWSCYEYRAHGGTSGSRCHRLVNACRNAAAEKSREVSGSGTFAVSYEAGGCSEQKQAFCSYRWTEARYAKVHPSEFVCFRVLDDCKTAQANLHDDDGIAKQTECTGYD